MKATGKPRMVRRSRRINALSLMDLPNEMLQYILEFCGIEELKKLLALKNKRLLAAIRKCKTKHFKYWTFKWISLERLRKLMEDVCIIKGVEFGACCKICQTADDIVEELIKERKELEYIEWDDSECSDKALQLLLSHPRMKVVRLGHSLVTGESFMAYGGSGGNYSLSITELNLAQCHHLTDDGIIAVLNQVGHKLKILNLNWTNVSFSHLGELTVSLPVLEEVNLVGCENLTDSSITEFINRTGGGLKLLSLACTRVSFSELGSLASLPLLETLNLARCEHITDSTLMQVINKVGSTLKTLNLPFTGVSFSAVGSLTSALPVLEYLNLRGCRDLEDAGLMAFLKKTSGQLELKIRHADLDAIQTAFPLLKISQY